MNPGYFWPELKRQVRPPLKSASVCSGVGAPELAWEDFIDPQWFCEFDKFPSAVLAHHYPEVPNLGDMTKLQEKEVYHDRDIDILVGGTPCQSFSVAGLRKGLEDPRGNLALELVRILSEKRPRWFVWENVPGVLSSNNGRDFAAIIQAFTEIGYGVSWRVLDAQYFGVPQRRRRVFVVGYLGDWRPSYRVLFESESLRGNIEAGRKERKEDAGDTEGGIRKAGPLKANPGTATDGMNEDTTSIYVTQENNKRTVGTLLARDHKGVNTFDIEEGKFAYAYSKSHRKTHVDVRFTDDGKANCLNTGGGCSNQSSMNMVVHGTQDPCVSHKAFALGRNSGQENATLQNLIVRKLTPIECERLQGFPDNYTQIPWKNKKAGHCPKGHRYKAMGNSMAVPVMKWIGERLYAIDQDIQNGN